jgi:hypothetical protein
VVLLPQDAPFRVDPYEVDEAPWQDPGMRPCALLNQRQLGSEWGQAKDDDAFSAVALDFN